MERRNLLKAMGALGIGSMLPVGRMRAGTRSPGDTVLQGVDCVLIPQETAGPYPLDLSKNDSMFRQDITEGKGGTPLQLILTIVNINDDCRPIQNARVDVWHCDKDGVYSGYSQPGANTVGQTFMRGIQMTDSNGRVEFSTMYPGWYAGRITHIHFQVFLNSVLSATSQVAFPDSLNTEVYNTSLYASHGQNTSVANNAADSVFGSPAGDLQYELLTMESDETTGGYIGSLTVGISAPTSGIIDLEPETGGQFKLGQNFPNPFKDRTTVSFTLTASANVELAVFDVTGKKIVDLFHGALEAGEQAVEWDRRIQGRHVPAGVYIYQLTVENEMGRFRQSKTMTVQ
jgi:protocatechuate 3,4-dioxygenase beta subunit